MRLTVVLFVAASLVGTFTAKAATPPASMVSPAPASRSVLFDDAFLPAGCGCGEQAPVYDDGDSCGCGGGHHQGGCPACGECGCDGGCGCGCCKLCPTCWDSSCSEPCIRLRAEFLPLHRNTTESFVNFDGIFTTHDFDFTFAPGVRIAAETRVGCECSLEGVYLGMQRWHDEVLVVDGIGNETRASYTAQLHGGEINYWMPINWRSCRVKGAFTFGTKYLDLHEEFNFNTNGVVQDDSETDNRVLVADIGFMLSAELVHGFSVRWDGKAGVGANLSSRQTSFPLVDFPRQEDADAAFLGDTNVVLSYQLCCNVSIYAGYYLMWADGLALAPEQFLVPPNQINHNASLCFHGGLVGVETTW